MADPEPTNRPDLGTDTWAWACAACAMQRGLSYLIRPPSTNSRTESVIEHFIPYNVWGWLLVSIAVLIAFGIAAECRLTELVAHILCAAAYALLSLSVILSAVFLGQQWAPSGALAFIALVHLARVKYIARRLGKRGKA